ncbi:MAG: class I adenylate-forming enzyme family protein [Gammaproteobacteria bacterium]
MLIGDLLETNAATWPGVDAIVAGERRMSYAQLHARAGCLSRALAGTAAPGDRVAILSTNRPEYVEAFYGVPTAGMILTLLNYRLTAREWGFILRDAGVRVLLVEARFVQDLGEAMQGLDALERVIVIGDAPQGWQAYEEFLAAAPREVSLPPAREDDVACLIYTSGTTGFPKGAMISHRNIVSGALAAALEQRLPVHPRALLSFPMCHASGFTIFMHHLRAGTLFLPPAFAPGEWLADVEAHRITHANLAPTMASFVLEHPDWPKADLSSLQMLSYGGMAMSASVARALAPRVGSLTTGFGQSESTFLVTYMDDAWHRRALAGQEEILKSCGRAMALSTVDVLDENLQRCAPGTVGELCVRGPLVMRGYWNNPQATAEATQGGWLHTGDLARRDEHGLFYIVDRQKDMLKTGGQNVYPREVEQLLVTHPAVREVAVVGMPDPVWGENVVAAVVRHAGESLTGQELIAWCAGRIAGYKKPRHVVFVDELPHNVTGKVIKRELRERLAARLPKNEEVS